MPAGTPATRPDDEDLVRSAQAGDYPAFEELVRRHQKNVYALALGMLRNTAEAEEVAQETFLSAFTHLDSFRGEARFSTWLYRVTSNHALMRMRKKRPEPQGDTHDLEPRMSTQGTSPFDALTLWARRPDEALESREVEGALEAAMARLDPEDRSLILLRAFESASHEDLAHLFNTTVPAVKSRLHRARLLLRQLLDEGLRGKPPR